MKILVIEDEKLLAQSIRAVLEQKGFDVETVYDGETGAEYARLGIYDLLILDVMMPGMSGYEVCTAIREFSNVPILFLTAKSAEEDRICAYKSGGDDFLSKPFSQVCLQYRHRRQRGHH